MLASVLTDSPFPLFFNLELFGAFPRGKIQEVGEQAVKLAWLLEHGEMAGLFKYDEVNFLRQRDELIGEWWLYGGVIPTMNEQAGRV